jgi:hypothetical protein
MQKNAKVKTLVHDIIAERVDGPFLASTKLQMSSCDLPRKLASFRES